MHHTTENKEKHPVHITSYSDHFITLVILLSLTALTVAVSVLAGGQGVSSVIIALALASAKGLLVAYLFMHLKYDKKIYSWMFFVVLAMFAIFLIILSIDYLNR